LIFMNGRPRFRVPLVVVIILSCIPPDEVSTSGDTMPVTP
jgi:hypothetical protein